MWSYNITSKHYDAMYEQSRRLIYEVRLRMDGDDTITLHGYSKFRCFLIFDANVCLTVAAHLAASFLFISFAVLPHSWAVLIFFYEQKYILCDHTLTPVTQ